MRTLKIVLLLVFSLAVALYFRSASITPVLAESESASALAEHAQPDPADDLSQYVGSTACAECHANEAAQYSLTVHRKTNVPGAEPDLRGCEACHGGAKKHLEFHQAAQQLIKEGKDAEAQALYADETKAREAGMRDLRAMSSAQAAAVCLKCHEGTQGRAEERFNFRRSEHFRHGVSCLDCHSSHAPKRTEFLLRDSEPEACFRCHQDQKAAFSRPFHHKVPEGGMKCSDCHNQHGGFEQKQLRSWVGSDVTCTKCHADKAGPFVYEHAPVKVEGCQVCHTPHGSTNPRLLKRNDIRFLCLECHSNTPGTPAEEGGVGTTTPGFHNLSQARFANCTVCHVSIHGSNNHPAFFR